MSALTAGRVRTDRLLHAVSSSSPPYALCGAGIIIARVGAAFPVHDPASCQACCALFAPPGADVQG